MAQPMKPMDDAAIEDSVIDDTFRNVANPLEIHRLGREDIVDNRPGDVLVDAVKRFSAKGGFAKNSTPETDDGVKVSIEAAGRLGIEDAKDVTVGAETEFKNSDAPE